MSTPYWAVRDALGQFAGILTEDDVDGTSFILEETDTDGTDVILEEISATGATGPWVVRDEITDEV